MDIRLPTRQTFNQREADACLSCAIATALEGRGADVPALAATFHLYYAYGGSPARGGMTISRAQLIQTQYGICARLYYRHDVGAGTPGTEPNEEAILDGQRRRTLSDTDGEWTFRRLPGLHPPGEWLMALREGYPVLLRIWLNPGYQAMKGNAANPVWEDTSNPGQESHAVVVLGYEESKERFIVQDSRGNDCFRNGQWFLPETQAVMGPITDAYVLRVPIENLI